MKNKRIRKKIIFFAIGLSALLVIGSISFISFSEKVQELFLNQTSSTLSEYTENNALATKNELESVLEILEISSNEFIGLQDSTKIISNLQKIVTKTAFYNIQISDINGNAIDKNGVEENIFEKDYFKKASFGNDSILSEDKDTIIVSVPIVNQGKITGVICGFYDIFSLSELVETHNFDGESFSIIVDFNGNIVIPSYSSYVKEENNIIEYLDNSKITEGSVEDFTNDFITRNKGFVSYKNKGSSMVMYYTPISINNWYLLKVVTGAKVDEMSEPFRATVMKFTFFIFTLLIISVISAFYIIITYTNEKNNQLKELVIKANSANKAKTQFLSKISHDIRTPMNGIIGMTNIAIEEINSQDTVKNCLEKIDLSSKFLLGLMNDVLDMSKIENESVKLHPEPYRLLEFQNYMDTLFRPMCEKKNIFLDMRVVETDYVVMVDKLRFNQIIINILSNAVKYTNYGGKIDTFCENVINEKGKLKFDIIVKDNGIGMSQEFIQHMFEMFTQEKESAASNGTGLGLAIVKQLTELIGGKIDVESEYGIGTKFTVHFCLDLCDEKILEDKNAREDYSKLKGKRILVCEDNEINQEIIVRILKKVGIEVSSATNGLEGIELFINSAVGYYDAILMDIKMPVMDGIRTTKKLRKIKRIDSQTIPIIAMTANAYDEDRENTKKAGMNEHLSKPIDINELYETLLKYIV